jgi:methionyl-tRNA formyltransferase
MNKITLCIMTYKGLAVLKSLIMNNLNMYIDKVIVGIDNTVINDYSKNIISLCVSNDITYLLRKNQLTFSAKYILAISWKWMLNTKGPEVIIIHDSLLPKYRGFAPLVNQLLDNKKEIGITALFATTEYDRGNIIAQKKIVIDYPIKIQKAIEYISNLYGDLAVELITTIAKNEKLKGIPQNEEIATYSLWRDDKDYNIDWRKSSSFICRFIDAVGFPYNGATTFSGNKKIKINSASIIDDVKIHNRKKQIGKIIFIQSEKPIVICGSGLIRIDDAEYVDSNKNILPLRKFRIRFSNNGDSE